MSGAGRKHRAKQLTSDFLDESWTAKLDEGEEVAVVKSTSGGGKQLMVEFPLDGKVMSVGIPGKFHKVVWLLRHDPVIVAYRASLVRKLTQPQLESLAAINESAAVLVALKAEQQEEPEGDEATDANEYANPNRVRYLSRRRVTEEEEDEEEDDEEEESSEDETERLE
jgi:translation initiation factor IF-1